MRCLIPIFALALVAGCTAGESATSLREGMSPAQVEAIMGRPDGFQRSGDKVGYQYTNRLISGWSWDRADYYAIFQDDRLSQWGAGVVRQGQQNGVLVVVPVR